MVTRQRVLLLGLASVTVFAMGCCGSSTRTQSPRNCTSCIAQGRSCHCWQNREDRFPVLSGRRIPVAWKNFSDVNMFSWPGFHPNMGSAYGLPLDAHQDKDTIETIISNRRFRKVLADLGGLDKSKASETVGKQLSNAVTAYLPLYADEKRVLAERFRVSDIDTNHSRGGLSFISGTTNDEVVLLGLVLMF